MLPAVHLHVCEHVAHQRLDHVESAEQVLVGRHLVRLRRVEGRAAHRHDGAVLADLHAGVEVEEVGRRLVLGARAPRRLLDDLACGADGGVVWWR